MLELPENAKAIKKEFEDIAHLLDERRIRLWCAAKARSYNRIYGRGGVMAVHKATHVSRPRIYLGIKEIKSEGKLEKSRIRKSGGGRKKVTEKQAGILEDLERLVEPLTRGDPESPLRWTCKSTYNLRNELIDQGYKISQPKVGKLLSDLGYSLQSNKKTREGKSHPDRNAQFEHINETVKIFQESGLPAISVDTKKKENIGNYANKGREYSKKGQPEEVEVYDFINKELGKVAPYGIYDLFRNEGFVNVGISKDTAEFAVNSIKTWWHEMGKAKYSHAKELLITADCGGSNGYRVKLWKVELQKLANETGMIINVCHFPPGTSKWNKIEHKMFSFISKNWRGKPLITRGTVVNLIGSTKTKSGLKIKVKLDENIYKTGRKITDKEFENVNIEQSDFHGEWNYKIKPGTDIV
jgi:transposase